MRKESGVFGTRVHILDQTQPNEVPELVGVVSCVGQGRRVALNHAGKLVEHTVPRREGEPARCQLDYGDSQRPDVRAHVEPVTTWCGRDGISNNSLS